MDLKHTLTRSEVNYGRIILKKSDGSIDFFSKLPARFNMKIRGRNLFDKTVNRRFRRISIGDDIMNQFEAEEVITISWNGEIVTIE